MSDYKLIDMYTTDMSGNRIPDPETEWRVPTEDDLNYLTNATLEFIIIDHSDDSIVCKVCGEHFDSLDEYREHCKENHVVNNLEWATSNSEITKSDS